jgi:hypothetical protein
MAWRLISIVRVEAEVEPNRSEKVDADYYEDQTKAIHVHWPLQRMTLDAPSQPRTEVPKGKYRPLDSEQWEQVIGEAWTD